jgi:hypothetical protein
MPNSVRIFIICSIALLAIDRWGLCVREESYGQLKVAYRVLETAPPHSEQIPAVLPVRLYAQDARWPRSGSQRSTAVGYWPSHYLRRLLGIIMRYGNTSTNQCNLPFGEACPNSMTN